MFQECKLIIWLLLMIFFILVERLRLTKLVYHRHIF